MVRSRSRLPLPWAVLASIVVLALCGVALARPARALAAPTPLATSTSHTALDLLSWELAAYAGPFGGFSNGFWNSPNTVCWSCNEGGPASAAATLYMLTGRTQPRLLHEAE